MLWQTRLRSTSIHCASGRTRSSPQQTTRDFSRGTTRERTPIDIAAVIDRSINMIAFDIRDANIKVERQVPAVSPPVMADAVQIQQVLVNLLKNAAEALAQHDGQRTILIYVRFGKRQVTVRVADSGPGVAPEIQDALFEPFTTHKSDGLGLGLAISRTIVQAHGGTISIGESPLGGAALEFTLPLDPLEP